MKQQLQWLTNKLEECEIEYEVAANNVYVLMLAIG
jgi:phosphodiesterase/alkaline phosphatase D-like protein